MFNFCCKITFGSEASLLSSPAIQYTKDVTVKSLSKIRYPKTFIEKIKILKLLNAETFL
jgi:hypothetical protein